LTLAERVKKIEVSLTPKQAVLRWLVEAQQAAGSLRQWIAQNAATLVDADPRIVISTQVANAVWDALRRKETLVEAVMRTQLQARKEAYFLGSSGILVA
jgi:predicted nucleic acid-binding protein